MVNNITYNKIFTILVETFGNCKVINNYEFMFMCPFCGSSKSNKPHFGINLKIDAYNCFRCGKSGRLSKLLKDIYGIIISFKINITEKNNNTKHEFRLLNKLSNESIRYIETRLGYDRLVDFLIKNSNVHINFIQYKNIEYLSMLSLYNKYITMRALSDDTYNKKLLIKIGECNVNDFFCFSLNKFNNSNLNILLFEGIFDALTHAIHVNNNRKNLIYIITNGKIKYKKISRIIKLYFNEPYNIEIFKDQDVNLKEVIEFKNMGNLKVYTFENSKDLNDSFVKNKLKDMIEVKI